jgi:hypothetical protein
MATASANVGANVFTIGYPLLDLMGREPKLTTGFINARTGIANDPRTYQISIPIQPGNSGGPVFNMKGEVIGIATSSLSAAAVFKWAGNLPQNVNYAVKTNYVRALLDATPVHGKETINTIEPLTGNLEELVQRVKDSIVIVIAGDTQPETTQQAKAPPQQPSQKSEQQPAQQPAQTNLKDKQTYALYVHFKPHNWDIRNFETKKGIDDTTINYSTNVGKMVKRYIEKVSHGKTTLKEETLGKRAKDLIYSAYDEDKRQDLCKKQDVDYLFSARNDNQSRGMADIIYYIFDCKSKADFYFRKNLNTNVSDSFMYESHLKKLLRNMLEDKPGSIGFIND